MPRHCSCLLCLEGHGTMSRSGDGPSSADGTGESRADYAPREFFQCHSQKSEVRRSSWSRRSQPTEDTSDGSSSPEAGRGEGHRGCAWSCMNANSKWKHNSAPVSYSSSDFRGDCSTSNSPAYFMKSLYGWESMALVRTEVIDLFAPC